MEQSESCVSRNDFEGVIIVLFMGDNFIRIIVDIGKYGKGVGELAG